MPVKPTVTTRLLITGLAAAVAVCALVALLAPDMAEAALRSAAGGGSGGAGGFERVVRYIDRVSTYAIAVGGALAVLGVIYGGSQFILGNPHAARTLGLVAAGVIVVLASKGLTA